MGVGLPIQLGGVVASAVDLDDETREPVEEVDSSLPGVDAEIDLSLRQLHPASIRVARKRASKPLAGGMYPAPRSVSSIRMRALPLRPRASSSMVTSRKDSRSTSLWLNPLSSARSARFGCTATMSVLRMLRNLMRGGDKNASGTRSVRLPARCRCQSGR